MQISKLKLGVCAVVLCWSIAGGQAADDDTPEQAAARAALQQHMQADSSTNSGVMIITNGAAENPTPMTPDQSNAIQDATATANADKAAADQAKAQKKAARAAAKAKARAEAQAREAAAQSDAYTPGPDTTPTQAAALAVLRKRMHDADAGVATVPVMTNGMAAPQTSVMTMPVPAKPADEPMAITPAPPAPPAPPTGVFPYSNKMGFKPVPVVPAPISPEKQIKLDDLLVQYQMNQISPEEYHKQRAAILAEP